MVLEQEKGGYARGLPVRMYGSFQTNATSAPTVIRDGGSQCIKSVTRVSAGLYNVVFDTGFPVPALDVVKFASLESTATPTIIAQANVVSWTASTRTLQIVCYHTSGTPGVGDPDTGSRIDFELAGSISSVGTDPA